MRTQGTAIHNRLVLLSVENVREYGTEPWDRGKAKLSGVLTFSVARLNLMSCTIETNEDEMWPCCAESDVDQWTDSDEDNE